MECKFCGAEIESEDLLCPVCGQDNKCETEPVACQMPEFCAEEIAEEMEQMSLETDVDKTGKPKRKIWKVILALVCCGTLLAALVVLILQGMGIDLSPRENDIYYKDSYTVNDKTAVRKADDVVAVIGDAELSNSQLQLLYWMQVDEFLRYYGSTYFDYQKPLDEQIVSEQTGLSWQQYFIEVSMQAWRRYQLLNMLADEGDYERIDEYRETLGGILVDLEQMAKDNQFENADAMIKTDMGAACSAQDYIDYVELYNVAMLFLNEKYEEMAPSMEDISAYYTENEADFNKSGITKDSGMLVDVRHILVQLDDPAAAGNGQVTYTDDQWEACRQKAQELLDKWKAGKADEDYFAELANANSKDGGSNTKGGLYTQVAQGEMVQAFNDWIFDEARITGDTGLVKTEFGYHVMYFVQSEAKWIVAARTNLLSDRIDDMIAAAEERWPMQINFKNIALTEIER